MHVYASSSCPADATASHADVTSDAKIRQGGGVISQGGGVREFV